MSGKVAVRREDLVSWRGSHVDDVIGAFESETAAVFLKTKPTSEHMILYVLVGIILLSITLMSVVKLDRVVTGAGRIVPSGGELYVSPFDTGIVRRVNVKVGDVVKKGQALALLDPTFTSADLKQLQEKLASDEAAVAREQAELTGSPYIYSSSDSHQSLQGNIYLKRQAEYRFNLANFDGQIHNAEAQVLQYRRDSDEYTKRLKLASDAEKLYQPLLAKGYVSKLQVMQASDSRTEMGRLLADAQNQMSALEQTMESLKAQRNAYKQKWQSDTGNQLVLDRNDLDVTKQLLQKAQKMSDLVSVDAPADGIVLRIGKVSAGSVTPGGGQNTVNVQGDPLFTMIPLGGSVDADVNVSSEDLGFIKAGDQVQIKLDAYRYMRHGTAKGVVKTISEGSFTIDQNGTPVPPYFKVRVAINEVHLFNVPKDFRLIPGMTLLGDIMVGKRTLLSYLVEGALRTGSEAMREP